MGVRAGLVVEGAGVSREQGVRSAARRGELRKGMRWWPHSDRRVVNAPELQA